MSTPVYKREGKAHLTFSDGFWAVLWHELTPENVDDAKETWLWVMRKNSVLSTQK